MRKMWRIGLLEKDNSFLASTFHFYSILSLAPFHCLVVLKVLFVHRYTASTPPLRSGMFVFQHLTQIRSWSKSRLAVRKTTASSCDADSFEIIRKTCPLMSTFSVFREIIADYLATAKISNWEPSSLFRIAVLFAAIYVYFQNWKLMLFCEPRST